MASAQHIFLIVFQVVDKATKNIKEIEANMMKVNKQFDKMNEKGRGFSMTALGITFFGMALQRFFGGAMRELFNVMKNLEGYNSDFLTSTQHLQAGWEFLKFTIIEALDNPIFIKFIMDIISVVDKTSEWIQTNELLVTKFAKFAIFGFVLGGILATVGTLINGFLSLSNGISWLAKNIGTVLVPVLDKISLVLTKVFMANPILAWVAVVIGGIFLISKKFGGFGETVKSILRGLMRFGAIFIDGFVTAFLFGWNMVISNIIKSIDIINTMIRKINNAFNTNFGTISTSGLTKAMSDYQVGDIVTKYGEFESQSMLAPDNGYLQKDQNLAQFYIDGKPYYESMNQNQQDTNQKLDEMLQLMNYNNGISGEGSSGISVIPQ